MTEGKHILHQAKIANNCPECYNAHGLEFTFFQKIHSNFLYRKTDSHLTAALFCHTCENDIYPVSWTADIERVYTYQYKIAESKKERFQMKGLGYFFIALLILLLVGFLGYLVL